VRCVVRCVVRCERLVKPMLTMFLILDLGANSSSILNNNILCETSSELITEQIRYVLYYITGCHVIVGVGSWQSNSMNIFY